MLRNTFELQLSAWSAGSHAQGVHAPCELGNLQVIGGMKEGAVGHLAEWLPIVLKAMKHSSPKLRRRAALAAGCFIHGGAIRAAIIVLP